MKYFVDYYDYSPVTGNLYQPCGDRSTVILDGRNKLATMIQDAHNLNGFRRPLYPHFKIMKGERFSNAVEVYSTF